MLDRDGTLERRMRAALNGIKDPCSLASGVPLGLDEMGLVDRIEFADDGAVTLKLRLTAPFCHMIGFFKTEASRLLSEFPGVTTVAVEADNGLDWSPSRISVEGQAKRAVQLERMRKTLAPAT